MNTVSDDVEISGIIRQLKEHETRLLKIEEHLSSGTAAVPLIKQEPAVHKKSLEEIEEDEILEFKIGQSFFAKTGILAFIVGIIFLLTLPLENLPAMFPILFGVAVSAGFLLLPNVIKNVLPHFHGHMIGGGIALLFFTVLRLQFFVEQPLIQSKFAEVILLNGVFAGGLLIALKRNSAYIASLAITLGYTAALIGENPYFIFASITIIAAISAYIKIKFKWENFFTFSIILGFFTHLMWMLNNPLLGNGVKIVTDPALNIFFLFVYLAVFNFAYTSRHAEKEEGALKIFNLATSGLLFYALLLAATLSGKNHEYFTVSHFAASIIFLSYSAFFWRKEKSKYITFFYAMFGYLALSSAIIYEYNIPNSFVLLCWQSLVVLSTAVWFRSRFIVVANFFIYLFILLLYLPMAEVISPVSLSFGIVALFSARILNWQKERLELKTENMRNLYLLFALLLIPYVFYKMFPAGYVALSWVGVAVTYYVLSNLMKIKKYRWMSLLTFLMTILYVSLLGLTSSELIYKVVSFLVLGSVLIGISVLYGKSKTKSAVLRKDEI
jgi:hypothetical protein